MKLRRSWFFGFSQVLTNDDKDGLARLPPFGISKLTATDSNPSTCNCGGTKLKAWQVDATSILGINFK